MALKPPSCPSYPSHMGVVISCCAPRQDYNLVTTVGDSLPGASRAVAWSGRLLAAGGGKKVRVFDGDQAGRGPTRGPPATRKRNRLLKSCRETC